MKQVWQAVDGTVFDTEKECAEYEMLGKWVNVFVRAAIGTKSDLSEKCQDWMQNSDFEFEAFHENRADIYKLAQIIKNTSVQVFGHE